MLQPQIFRYGSFMDQLPEFQLLKRNINRLFSALPQGTEFLAANIWIGKDDAILMTQLPGITPQELDISIVNDLIKITGTRKAETLNKGESYYRQERSSGPFSRTLQLPFPVDASKVEATYKKGILQIVLPRAEAEKPQRIVVKKD